MITEIPPENAANRKLHPLILVVEDEWLIRMFVVDGLREKGRCVVEAATGAEAVLLIQSGVPVDVIFTDERMPGPVSGLELLAFALRAVPAIPVIISSGHLVPAQALAAGAAAFLGKPYRLEEVERLIDASLGSNDG